MEEHLAALAVDGLVETCPGVRSLVIGIDQRRLPLSSLLAILEESEAGMEPADGLTLRTRVVHLPLAFNDRWTRDAIDNATRAACAPRRPTSPPTSTSWPPTTVRGWRSGAGGWPGKPRALGSGCPISWLSTLTVNYLTIDINKHILHTT